MGAVCINFSNQKRRIPRSLIGELKMSTDQIQKGETNALVPAPDRNALLERCRKLADHPSILSVLDEDLRARGFAGPTHIPQLVFLSLYTRMFSEPVSL